MRGANTTRRPSRLLLPAALLALLLTSCGVENASPSAAEPIDSPTSTTTTTLPGDRSTPVRDDRTTAPAVTRSEPVNSIADSLPDLGKAPRFDVPNGMFENRNDRGTGIGSLCWAVRELQLVDLDVMMKQTLASDHFETDEDRAYFRSQLPDLSSRGNASEIEAALTSDVARQTIGALRLQDFADGIVTTALDRERGSSGRASEAQPDSSATLSRLAGYDAFLQAAIDPESGCEF